MAKQRLFFIILFFQLKLLAEPACGIQLSTSLPRTVHDFSELAVACEDSTCNQKGTDTKQFDEILFGGKYLISFDTSPLEIYKESIQNYIQKPHCEKSCKEENISFVDMNVEPANPEKPPPKCEAPDVKQQKAIEYTIKFVGKTCHETETKVEEWIKAIALESNKEGKDLDKKTPEGCSITAVQSVYSLKSDSGCQTTAIFKAKFSQQRSDYNFKAKAVVINQWVCQPKDRK